MKQTTKVLTVLALASASPVLLPVATVVLSAAVGPVLTVLVWRRVLVGVLGTMGGRR